MAEAPVTEAPLKRKLEGASVATECKKPRDCVSPDIAAATPAFLSQEDTTVIHGNFAQRCQNGSGVGTPTLPFSTSAGSEEQANSAEIDGCLLKHDGNSARNRDLQPSAGASGSTSAGFKEGKPKLPDFVAAGSEEPLGDGEANVSEIDGCLLKHNGSSVRNRVLKPSAGASGSSPAGFEESEALGEGEVLEAAVEQDDDDDVRGDEDDENEEVSEIDTENNCEDEDESEGEGSDEGEDDSDDEDDEEEMPTSTSSSLQAEAARKGKAIDEGKGKEKMIDVKGKGKAIAEDEATPGSDEDDAGYLSEDPLEEVDLNNILPTRTRRRSSNTHYDFVDHGDDEEEDDDDDSDA